MVATLDQTQALAVVRVQTQVQQVAELVELVATVRPALL
jgi:hypothetical protein